MRRACFLTPTLVAALATPLPFNLRTRSDTGRATGADSALVLTVLRRGLYADSLIVPAAGSTWPQKMFRSDGSRDTNYVRTAFLFGQVTSRSEMLDIRLVVQDLLLRTIAGPDTLRVERGQADSVVAERGRRYARVLVR